ncbi:Hypothetical predicted protein [Lynx pardinus]|uniref:Uncharacterized protein n=1 Tax=Lynx pardinus TaxID=191816 RepID=A0A485PSP5_LYNPA|nr:Hypothetical predicted protein [Lynx pardinus]
MDWAFRGFYTSVQNPLRRAPGGPRHTWKRLSFPAPPGMLPVPGQTLSLLKDRAGPGAKGLQGPGFGPRIQRGSWINRQEVASKDEPAEHQTVLAHVHSGVCSGEAEAMQAVLAALDVHAHTSPLKANLQSPFPRSRETLFGKTRPPQPWGFWSPSSAGFLAWWTVRCAGEAATGWSLVCKRGVDVLDGWPARPQSQEAAGGGAGLAAGGAAGAVVPLTGRKLGAGARDEACPEPSELFSTLTQTGSRHGGLQAAGQGQAGRRHWGPRARGSAPCSEWAGPRRAASGAWPWGRGLGASGPPLSPAPTPFPGAGGGGGGALPGPLGAWEPRQTQQPPGGSSGPGPHGSGLPCQRRCPSCVVEAAQDLATASPRRASGPAPAPVLPAGRAPPPPDSECLKAASTPGLGHKAVVGAKQGRGLANDRSPGDGHNMLSPRTSLSCASSQQRGGASPGLRGAPCRAGPGWALAGAPASPPHPVETLRQTAEVRGGQWAAERQEPGGAPGSSHPALTCPRPPGHPRRGPSGQPGPPTRYSPPDLLSLFGDNSEVRKDLGIPHPHPESRIRPRPPGSVPLGPGPSASFSTAAAPSAPISTSRHLSPSCRHPCSCLRTQGLSVRLPLARPLAISGAPLNPCPSPLCQLPHPPSGLPRLGLLRARAPPGSPAPLPSPLVTDTQHPTPHLGGTL